MSWKSFNLQVVNSAFRAIKRDRLNYCLGEKPNLLAIMNTFLHQHLETSRRPIVGVVAVLAVGMIWFGFARAAPWYVFPPVFAALAMSVWMLVGGRISGCELTSQELRLFSGRWERLISLSDVTAFSVTTWSEGPDWITLHIEGKADFVIPSHCTGNAKALAVALEAQGISRT